MKSLIQKYNHSKTILVVSSYPDKKEGIKNLNAVAWYAQKTIKCLPITNLQSVVILAEIIKEPEIYLDGRLLIVRCWHRNSPLMPIEILRQVTRFNKAQKILIEFEFNTFGGFIGTAFFPFLLLFLKILQKKIILELHQVLLDISSLSGHLDLNKKSFRIRFFNFCLKNFYRLAGCLSDKILVLEEELKTRLANFVPEEKITALFIAISQKRQISHTEARKILGLKKKGLVLLYFGFITWYKGADWLVKEAQNKKFRLILAGGQSPTLKSKSHYQKFYRKVLSLASKRSNVQITGFVEEKDVALYFAACDLVVLPYRAFMSSSGPFSLALTYRKPFILSKALEGYATAKDFTKALKMSSQTKENIFFDLKSDSFKEKLKGLDLNSLKKLSTNLAKMRTAENLGKIYLKEIENVSHPAYNYRFGALLAKLRAGRLAFRVG